MNRQRQTRILTVVVLALTLVAVVLKRTGCPSPGAPSASSGGVSPQDAIYSMLDAAREGDVKRYVAAYSGRMEAAIRQAVAEKSPASFARYLRESNAAIKGIAILEPEVLTDRQVRVLVEYVHADRNEVQTMYLEKVSGEWKIYQVAAAERVPTLIPYGTPVN